MAEVILITGASQGIGYQTAKLAAKQGHTVIATALNESLLQELPDNVAMKLVIDICDQLTIDAALQQIKAANLQITCLINNAGFAQVGPVELVDEKRLRAQFDVNFFGTLAMTRSVLPQMKAQHRGRIITLSSMLGLISLPFQGIYAASKHALEAAFDALRMELARFHIEVVLIEPGWISTSFLKTSMATAPAEWMNDPCYGKPLSKYFAISTEAETENPKGQAKVAAAMAGTAEAVAQTVLTAVEVKKPKARYPVTGMARWLPRLRHLLPARVWDKMHASQF